VQGVWGIAKDRDVVKCRVLGCSILMKYDMDYGLENMRSALMKLLNLLSILIIFICCVSCNHVVKIDKQDLDWNKPIECNYQEGHDIGNESIETNSKFIFKNVHNSTKLTWLFYDLMTGSPKFSSAGDSDVVSVNSVKGSYIEGVSIQIPQRNGNNSFVIWQDGASFWNKINDIFGMKASQQYLGVCNNVTN